MMTFGERIQLARKAKGLTLEQLGKAIRSHKGYISGIENGEVNAPSPKLIPALCRKLDLPYDEMAALAYWEKRPKNISTLAFHDLVTKILGEEAAGTRPPAQKAAV